MPARLPKKILSDQARSVTVSSLTVVKIIGIIGLVVFLWFIRDVLGILFVALVFASALDPSIDRLERYRIPRGISILGFYFLFICVVGGAIYLIIPPLISQISEIGRSLQQFTPQIDAFYQRIAHADNVSLIDQIQKNLSSLNSGLSNITSSVYGFITDFFGRITAFVLVMVMAFYMTIEEDGIKQFIRSIAPVEYQPYLVQKINRIQTKMGAWLRGQLILMFIIGLLSFIGLFFLQVPYALVLALAAGLLEFVPYLGPILAAVPAVFFAYTDSPWKALGVLILYIVVQQLENQVIVPKVMQKAVGLHPIVVIAVMLIGAKIAGVIGILLAVPATTILWIFLEDIFEQKKEQDNALAVEGETTIATHD